MFSIWGGFFKIFIPGGVPEGGSIFTILRSQGPNTSKNTKIFQKYFFFIYSPTSLLCSGKNMQIFSLHWNWSILTVLQSIVGVQLLHFRETNLR